MKQAEPLHLDKIKSDVQHQFNTGRKTATSNSNVSTYQLLLWLLGNASSSHKGELHRHEPDSQRPEQPLFPPCPAEGEGTSTFQGKAQNKLCPAQALGVKRYCLHILKIQIVRRQRCHQVIGKETCTVLYLHCYCVKQETHTDLSVFNCQLENIRGADVQLHCLLLKYYWGWLASRLSQCLNSPTQPPALGQD